MRQHIVERSGAALAHLDGLTMAGRSKAARDDGARARLLLFLAAAGQEHSAAGLAGVTERGPSVGFETQPLGLRLGSMDAGHTGVASLMRIVLQEHGRFGITANIIATDLFATKAAEALV